MTNNLALMLALIGLAFVGLASLRLADATTAATVERPRMYAEALPPEARLEEQRDESFSYFTNWY